MQMLLINVYIGRFSALQSSMSCNSFNGHIPTSIKAQDALWNILNNF